MGKFNQISPAPRTNNSKHIFFFQTKLFLGVTPPIYLCATKTLSTSFKGCNWPYRPLTKYWQNLDIEYFISPNISWSVWWVGTHYKGEMSIIGNFFIFHQSSPPHTIFLFVCENTIFRKTLIDDSQLDAKETFSRQIQLTNCALENLISLNFTTIYSFFLKKKNINN